MSNLKISGLKLHNMIDVNNKEWKNLKTTNCYAYALGLDIPEYSIIKDAFSTIGMMAISNDHEMTPEEKHYIPDVERLKMDLDFLKIKYEEADPFELVKDNEWLIAYYNCPFTPGYDFHFVRRNKDGIWTHKCGWKGGLSTVDDYDLPITDPKKAFFDFYVFEKCLKLRK